MLVRLAKSTMQHAENRPSRGWLPSSRERPQSSLRRLRTLVCARAVGRGWGWGARSGGGSTPCPRQGRAQNKLSKEGIPRRIAPESIPRRFTLQNALIIDDHAPRNAADRDRDGGLAAVDVDHCDVIAEAIRHEHGSLVARARYHHGALADALGARDIVGR